MDIINKCNKCGEDVPENNDARYLDVLLGDWTAFVGQSRHLLPTDNCEGSPSRAQYLEGQPKDSRGTYPYESYWEMRIREAYKSMQRDL